MYAIKLTGLFYRCVCCGIQPVSQLEEFTAYYDKDGDHHSSSEDYGSLQEATEDIEENGDEETYLPLSEREELECTNCSDCTTCLDNLRQPATKASVVLLSEVWLCGSCKAKHTDPEQAGDCCNES